MTARKSLIGVALAAAVVAVAISQAGPLDPPGGGPAPTMKTLDQVEPRIPINDENTPGDADSRFRIDTPGSYYLTENLFARDGKHGIEIATSGVTVDLSGFTMIGLLFPPAQSLDGIHVPNQGFADIAIRNGHIRVWGGDGIEMGSVAGALIENVNVSNCGGSGVKAGLNGRVVNCHAEKNQQNGFTGSGVFIGCVGVDNTLDGFTLNGATVADCLAEQNDRSGFDLSNAAATGCEAVGNADDGFNLDASNAADCVSNANQGDGFDLVDSSATANTARGNVRHGINASFLCGVRDNHVLFNQMDGVHVRGGSCRVDGNVAASNGDIGVRVTAAGCFVVRNTASNNNDGQFSVDASSARGPIIDASAGGIITSTNPHANIIN